MTESVGFEPEGERVRDPAASWRMAGDHEARAATGFRHGREWTSGRSTADVAPLRIRGLPESGTGTLRLGGWDEREIVLTRPFAGPRAALFAALTTPRAIVRWLAGPPGWTMPVCEVDPRTGGRYRCLWRHAASGRERRVHGVYRAVVADEFLVQAARLDPAVCPGEAVATTVLTQEGGRTMLRASLLFASRAARDRVLASPLPARLAASYDRLEAFVAAGATAAGLSRW